MVKLFNNLIDLYEAWNEARSGELNWHKLKVLKSDRTPSKSPLSGA